MIVTRQLATRDTQQANVVSQLWQKRESTFKDRSEWMPGPIQTSDKRQFFKTVLFQIFLLDKCSLTFPIPVTYLREGSQN